MFFVRLKDNAEAGGDRRRRKRNMRDRCSECGRMVDGQYVKGTSVGEDTRSALKTVAKVGV